MKTYCKQTGKRQFKTALDAQLFIYHYNNKITQQHLHEQKYLHNVYQCPFCEKFHLTSKQ